MSNNNNNRTTPAAETADSEIGTAGAWRAFGAQQTVIVEFSSGRTRTLNLSVRADREWFVEHGNRTDVRWFFPNTETTETTETETKAKITTALATLEYEHLRASQQIDTLDRVIANIARSGQTWRDLRNLQSVRRDLCDRLTVIQTGLHLAVRETIARA